MSAAPAPPPRRGTAVGVSAAVVLLAGLDAYVVVTILVAIVRDLQIPINRLERATPIVTGYLLGYVAAMPLLARLSDRIGRRIVIQLCLAGFAAGSLISAVAGSLPVLVAGRLIQGAAGGALLPVAFALAGDLWDERDRAPRLGFLGGAQEFGSVVGPLYGAGLAALAGWRSVFWINLPLAAVAAVAIHRAVPGGRPRSEEPRFDPVGGALLAASLGGVIIGLYNPDPAAAVLPSWGPWAIGAGVAGFVAFGLWERRSPAPLVRWASVEPRPFAATAAGSFLSGAALMVTLVDVPLLAETLLGKDTLGAALVLLRFLVALPIGAVIGGWLASRVEERATAVIGFVLAGFAYWLVAGWPLRAEAARYALGAVSVPAIDTALVMAGLGLGLVIAPFASVALRSVDAAQHGVASAAVVVTRMMGMLVGVAALAAWGLHRFRTLTADLVPPIPFGQSKAQFAQALTRYRQDVGVALHTQYREVFLITAVLCAIGAMVCLLLGQARRGEA